MSENLGGDCNIWGTLVFCCLRQTSLNGEAATAPVQGALEKALLCWKHKTYGWIYATFSIVEMNFGDYSFRSLTPHTTEIHRCTSSTINGSKQRRQYKLRCGIDSAKLFRHSQVNIWQFWSSAYILITESKLRKFAVRAAHSCVRTTVHGTCVRCISAFKSRAP